MVVRASGWEIVDVAAARSEVSVSGLPALALLVDPSRKGTAEPGGTVQDLLSFVKAVAREQHAIKIRAARLLAWAKGQDAQAVGCSGWVAFVKEHAPWGVSRTRDYVRLALSRLEVIKEAVSRNVISPTIATRAPRDLGDEASAEAQLAWLHDVKMGWLPEGRGACTDAVSGDDARCVSDAREHGAMLLGGDASTPVIDQFLIDCHAQELTEEQILERGRATPPVPDRIGRPVPEWMNEPAEPLLGPWVDPSDLRDCVEKIGAVRRLLHRRRMVLGLAYHRITEEELWRSVPGCGSLEQLCRVHLGIGQRTLQRHAREGRTILERPELQTEIEQGELTVDRAMLAARRAQGSRIALRGWIELLRRLGGAELQHALERDVDPLRAHARVMEMARAVEAVLARDAEAPACEAAPDASGIGATAERIARHLRERGATGRVQVAVRDDRNRRTRRGGGILFVRPGLVAAAKYLLRVLSLPAVHGVRRVVESDRYTCQSPRCRRRTLRVHVHHLHDREAGAKAGRFTGRIVRRQHGGGDEPGNVIAQCPACHLRGIHSGNMSVVRIDDWLVWTWPVSRGGGPGTAVIMDSPVQR
jgi:hypothetical protein